MTGFLDHLLQPGQTKSELVNLLIAKEDDRRKIQKLVEPANNEGNRSTVNQYLLKHFTPAVAAGIAGNIDVETGGTFDYRQKQIGGGGGEGLFQFTYPPMKRAYIQYLDKNKLSDGAPSQIDFMKSSLESSKDYDIGTKARRALKEAFSTNDPTIISEAFMNHFEKPGVPHEDRRFKSSQKHFKEFSQN